MSEDRQNLEALFEAAHKLADEAQRRAFLDVACAQNPTLRSRIEELLSAASEADGFFKECGPALKLPAAETRVEEDAAKAEGTIRLAGTSEQPPGGRIGHYKLLEKIGEGGYGIVYVAEQEAPVRRRVALKIIKPGMDTKQVVARFEAERQALAMMDHPNIAKVLDAGATDHGRPYFVMELVRGIRFTEYADQNHLDTTQRLELFAQVCSAVQHAHQKGIIHRDIKPSNILVTLHDGVPVPKVIDFGIAKALEGRLTELTVYTELRQFIGTPAYMSPEQAEMSGLDIDTRSDIYSLGVLLYELLTGRTPFDPKELLARGLDEVRRTIREVEPVRPSTRLSTLANADLSAVAKCHHTEAPRLLALVRGDLDWIVMKCLEKDRTRRYETANGLAMDVRRFLQNDPVSARPPSKTYQIRKWVQRHRIGVTASGTVLLALVMGLGITSWALVREHAARRESDILRRSEQQQRSRAEAEELSARRFSYASDMNLAQQALAANNLGRTRELLERNRPKPGHLDLRGWEWRYLRRQSGSDSLFTLVRNSDSILAAVFLQNDRKVVLRTAWGKTEVWDVASRARVADLGGYGTGRELAVAPDGNLIAFGATNTLGAPVIKIWSFDSNSTIATVPDMGDAGSIAFSPDGAMLAIYTSSHGVQLWSAKEDQTSRLCQTVGRGGGYQGVVTFSPDGKSLAVGDTDGQIRIIELATKKQKLMFDASADGITALAFSPDGALLASGSGYSEKEIRLWDVSAGKHAGDILGHTSWITALVFTPDGRKLVSASGDQTIRIWEIATRRETDLLRGHESEIYTLNLTKNGNMAISGSKDGEARIWDLTGVRGTRAYSIAAKPVRLIRFSPNSGTLASVNLDGSVSLWDPKTLAETDDLRELGKNNWALAFSNAGERIVLSDLSGRLKIWDLISRKELTNFVAYDSGFWPGPFLAGGKELHVFDFNSGVQRWDAVSWKKLISWPMHPNVTKANVSPDERMVASGYSDGTICLWNLADGRELARFKGHSRWVTAIQFSADSKTLFTGSEDGLVKIWDTTTHRALGVLKGHLLGVHSLALSPDGQRLASGSDAEEAVKIWDLNTRQELLNLNGQGSAFHDTEFSPDGSSLVSINSQGLLHLWRAAPTNAINSDEPGGGQ